VKIIENLNEIISKNLKYLRHERNLSLEQLSEITGVSKSMLGQIERAESNPTINTLWKITNGLDVSFSRIMRTKDPVNMIIKDEDIKTIIEDDGKYMLYPIINKDSDRNFEVYKVEVLKNGKLKSNSHKEGTQEFITVFSGELVIKIKDEEFRIKKGQSFRFQADEPHRYINSGKKKTKFSMIIYYPY